MTDTTTSVTQKTKNFDLKKIFFFLKNRDITEAKPFTCTDKSYRFLRLANFPRFRLCILPLTENTKKENISDLKKI